MGRLSCRFTRTSPDSHGPSLSGSSLLPGNRHRFSKCRFSGIRLTPPNSESLPHGFDASSSAAHDSDGDKTPSRPPALREPIAPFHRPFQNTPLLVPYISSLLRSSFVSTPPRFPVNVHVHLTRLPRSFPHIIFYQTSHISSVDHISTCIRDS